MEIERVGQLSWNTGYIQPTMIMGSTWVYDSGLVLGLDFSGGWAFLINEIRVDTLGEEQGEKVPTDSFVAGGITLGLDFKIGYAW